MAFTKKQTQPGTDNTHKEDQWIDIVPPQTVLTIQQARYMGDYVLCLQFSDGHETQVDFATFLQASQHPDIRRYLDKEQFVGYALVHGSLMWGDFEMLFPLADLYKGKV